MRINQVLNFKQNKMSLTLNQVNFEEVVKQNYDIVIAATGFESRASFQIPKLKGTHSCKIALSFANEANNNTRLQNDSIFLSHNFEIANDLTDFNYFENLMTSETKGFSEKSEIKVYVDYSSMSRNMYSQILLAAKIVSLTKKVTVFFGYSHSIFAEIKKEENLNRIVEPIFGFCKLSVPHKPTALIVCLGNEISRVYGLTDFFDATTYLFYSDTKFDNKFSAEVEIVNEEIIDATDPDKIFKFPVEDLIYTNQVLENLCRSLTAHYRVVLAPCGPKPFALLSLINALNLNNDIEVWRISPGEDLQVIDRKPNERVSVLKIEMGSAH